MRFDSSDFAHSRFPPHGHSTADVDGRVLRVSAHGPFNLELAQAHLRLMNAAGRHLPKDQRFIEVFYYYDSLLMPPQAWRMVADYVDQAVALGFRAQATVIVLGRDVEGEELFGKGIEQIWARSRPVTRVYTAEEAETLVARLLREYGLLDAPPA